MYTNHLPQTNLNRTTQVDDSIQLDRSQNTPERRFAKEEAQIDDVNAIN